MNFNEEKQARHDLAALLKQKSHGHDLPPQIAGAAVDVPVRTTLRSLGKQYRLAIDHGKREAIKATMRLMVKHRFLYALPLTELEARLYEAAGLKQRAPRPAVTDQSANEGR